MGRRGRGGPGPGVDGLDGPSSTWGRRRASKDASPSVAASPSLGDVSQHFYCPTVRLDKQRQTHPNVPFDFSEV